MTLVGGAACPEHCHFSNHHHHYLLCCSDHVLSSPARDWNKGDSHRVVANLLEEAAHASHHFVKAFLAVRRRRQVHLVHTDYDLLDAQSVRQ